jgi:hypothetical protein
MFSALILFSSLPAVAQVPVDDDMPDTRSKNESFAKLPKNEIRTDLACFTMGGIDESAGKGDLKIVSFSGFTPNSMSIAGEGVKATVTTAAFDQSRHKLQYSDQYLIKIDKKTYYGGYPNLPKTFISQVLVIIDKDTVVIPAGAYSDLYNLNLVYKDKAGTERSKNALYFSKYGKRVYLYLFCKDQTGSYEVTFIIQDKKYLRRVVDYGFM